MAYMALDDGIVPCRLKNDEADGGQMTTVHMPTSLGNVAPLGARPMETTVIRLPEQQAHVTTAAAHGQRVGHRTSPLLSVRRKDTAPTSPRSRSRSLLEDAGRKASRSPTSRRDSADPR
eukprot:3457578-Karenia_brevis.AAC.1